PLRISWGKPVPLPSKPLYVLGEDEAPTGQPFNARSGVADDVPEVQVARPTNNRTLRLIHWTVEHVIRHGPRFECLLISRVHDDPRFRFLVDWQSADHAYYRWRMYSLLCGDTKDHWRQRMFMMYDAVPVWVPPTVAVHPVAWNLESSESEEHGDTELSSRTRGRLQRRVDRVQNSGRGVIASAMAMAVECAHAPEQVVDIVCQAFANAQTPTAKLAKLHLVSDILHNSAAPVANAWRLRQAFEPRLEEVFDALVLAHRAIDARLRAEQFRKRVLAVLAVWETWVVYPAERIYELAANTNNVRVYTVSGSSLTSKLPDWLVRRKRRELQKDIEWTRRIELIQDFGFPEAAMRIKVTPDNQFCMATGVYKPQIRVFDFSNVAMKFDRHTDSENVNFLMLSDDWTKSVHLQNDRSLEFHNEGQMHFRIRV
ncbi:hypothetical protein LPJ70_006046, partial [Coemansia sp. RSA 2708]